MKIAIILASAVLALGAIAFVAVRHYSTMESKLPPRSVHMDIDAMELAGPGALPVLGTGSMAPYIPAAPEGRDPRATIVAYVKTERTPFEDLRVGDLVSYRKGAINILHQLAERSGDGWIPSGLHNERFDGTLVTAANYRARVVHTFIVSNP